jgi:hypothetical protein
MLEKKDAGGILDSRLAIYAKFASILPKEAHVFRVVTTPGSPELADRCACNNFELKYESIHPILSLPHRAVAQPVEFGGTSAVSLRYLHPLRHWQILD